MVIEILDIVVLVVLTMVWSRTSRPFRGLTDKFRLHELQQEAEKNKTARSLMELYTNQEELFRRRQ